MGILDKLFGGGKGGKKSGPEEPAADKSVLIEKVRQSDLFKDLPPENLEELWSHMETIALKAGNNVISEGDEGDYYYLMVSGKAEVSRRLKGDAKPQVVAEFTEPTGFGEEALISNAKRNASVTMTTSGTLMRLSKDDFDEFVKEPILNWLSAGEAQKKISDGAKWIDVRDTVSGKEGRLHGALAIPMENVRERAGELTKDVFYICYCENGRLSSTGAFLLKQMGYDVAVLRGGLLGLKKAGIT